MKVIRVIIFAMLLASSTKAQIKNNGTIGDKLVSTYSTYDGSQTFASITYWTYDSHGALIKDSTAGTSYYNSQIVVHHYKYAIDSIVKSSSYIDTAIVYFNSKGLPAYERIMFGVTSNMYYNDKGELETIEYRRPYINYYGKLDTIVRRCDSIVYNNGNIVSYRINPVMGDTAFHTVTCTYYDREGSWLDIYPCDKFSGFTNQERAYLGDLNVSIFSKHLVKKVLADSVVVDYTYKYDSKNRLEECSIYSNYADNKSIPNYSLTLTAVYKP